MAITALPSPPKHFWVVLTLAAVWNGFGLYDWMMSMGGEAYYRAAGFNDAQVAYQLGFPVWMQTAWSIGVWLSVLGTVLLLLRRKEASTAFGVALVCALFSVAYQTLIVPGWPIMGAMTPMSWVIAAVCAGLTAYSVWMTKRGVFR